jgi:hypothetical protein
VEIFAEQDAPSVSLTPMFSLFSTGVFDIGGKFATDINSTSITGGKFTACVADTGGAPCHANISANFRTNFEITLMLFSGACGKMVYKKT